MRAMTLALGILGVGVTSFSGQSGPMRFEVASIKQNNSGDPRSFPTILPSGRVRFANVTLREVILQAYKIDFGLAQFTLVSTPGENAILGRKFDITAVPPANPGAGREQSLVMLRTLLAERFALRIHTEMRDLPVYALTVARQDGRLGPQFRASGNDCAAFQVGRREGKLTEADEPVDAKRVGFCLHHAAPPPGGWVERWAGSMSWLIRRIGGFVDRPIVDATGLTGKYDWHLVFAMRADSDNVNLASIYTAIQDQLGLRLVRRTAPYEVFVIDSVNDLPTPN